MQSTLRPEAAARNDEPRDLPEVVDELLISSCSRSMSSRFLISGLNGRCRLRFPLTALGSVVKLASASLVD
jgi:hypothetical protein